MIHDPGHSLPYPLSGVQRKKNFFGRFWPVAEPSAVPCESPQLAIINGEVIPASLVLTAVVGMENGGP